MKTDWVEFTLGNELIRILGEDGLLKFIDAKIDRLTLDIESGEEDHRDMNIEIHDQLVEYREKLIEKQPF